LEAQKKEIQDILKEIKTEIKEIMPGCNEISDIKNEMNKIEEFFRQQILKDNKFLDDFEIISEDDNK